MSDLVGNPDDRFSHNEAHIVLFDGSVVLEWQYGQKLNSKGKIFSYFVSPVL